MPDGLVTVAPSPAFFVALGLYVASSLCHVTAFVTAPKWTKRLATGLLFLAFVAHSTDISFRGIAGVHPGTSVREALGFLSWLVTGGYLLYSLKVRAPMIGSFVAPVAMVVLALARLSPSGEAVEGLGTLGRVHISLATTGVAIFFLATLLAIFYLLQERTFKRKNFDGLLFRKGVALETLDLWSHRLIAIGYPIFTVAIMLGAVWGAQRAQTWTRPEYPMALVTWLAFGGLLAARTAWGYRGRRAAIVTVLGFTASLLVLAIYFFRRVLA